MQISRVVTGSDGRSHFQEEELVFEPQGAGAEQGNGNDGSNDNQGAMLQRGSCPAGFNIVHR